MDLPERVVLSRRELVAAGFADDELRRARLRGDLWRPRRGRYSTCPPPPDAMTRHAAEVRAACAALSPDAVVSHVSAAAMYGLPSWRAPLGRVHVSRDRDHGGRVDRLLHVHAARIAADEIGSVDGVAVTGPARTVADCARTLPFEQAVVIADAALRAELVELVEPAELVDALARWPRRRGNGPARRVLAFADGRSESVGESRSRVAMRRAGLPTPVLQWEVDGVGRVDFAWPWLRTVGEFDGLIKYGRLLRPGQDAADVVVAEKIRADALRAEILGVARWIWREIDPFTAVAARLHRQFALGTSHGGRAPCTPG